VQICAKLSGVDYLRTDEVTVTLSDECRLTLSAENMETLKRHHIVDLILIDLTLPDGDDLTLARESGLPQNSIY
jgi:CheY-like chemotaxis protein